MKNLLYLLLTIPVFAIGQDEYPIETVVQKGHLKYITCATFSPDGEYLATGSLDNIIKLWDVSTEKEIRSLNGHTEKIRSVTFSPDGNHVLSASADNTAKVFDVLTGEILFTMEMPVDRMWQATYDATGTQILTMNDRYLNVVWDAQTGEKLGEFEKSYGTDISAQSFSPDGAKLIVADDYKRTITVNIGTEDTVAEFQFEKTQTYAWSPDGKYIAIGSTKLFAEVFESETGNMLHHLEDDPETQCDGCNTQVIFSNNSKYLLTGAKRDGLILWDVVKGKKVYKLMDCEDQVSDIAFSPDDKFVVARMGNDIYVFDSNSGVEKLHITSSLYEYYQPKFSPDSKYLITPGDNNTAELWSISSGRKAKLYEGYLSHGKDDGMDFSYDDWTDAGILRFLSAKAGIAVSPDGRYLVKGNIDSTVVMIDLQTGKVVQEFVGHSKSVWAFDFNSNGSILATAGGNSYIKLWNTETGEEIASLKGHRDLIFDIAFSFDNEYLVSGSWDGTIRIWEVKTGKQIQYIELGKTSPYTVRFTPGDLYILSGSLTNHFQLWEVDSGREFRSMIGHTDVVAGIDMESTDGNKLVSGSWDGTVKIWDLYTGMLRNKYEHEAGVVNAVAWHPDDVLIASAGSDQNIYLWDIEGQRITDTLKGHSATITSLAFTQDNKLISCSADGMIKVWDLEDWTSELFTIIQMDRNNWLSQNPNGFFDGTGKALKFVNYVSGMEVISVGSLFEKYYTPDLIKRINQGEVFNETGQSINNAINDRPETQIAITDTEFRGGSETIDWREEKVSITISVVTNSKPVEIRLYNNGKLILSEDWNKKVQFRGGGNTKTCDVELNNGTNEISAVVINENRTESSPVGITINFDGEAALMDLYILSIGINDYENSSYDLNYAVNDAKTFTKTMTDGAGTLFNSINEFVIRDKDAVKDEIEQAMKAIIEEAGPEDVFVFYYAGHGVMSLEDKDGNSDFYIVMHDVTNLYGDATLLIDKAVSATELQEFSRLIPAEKQLFILDACHSGGALESFAVRGGSRELALAQLAHSTGTYFLTASQDYQFANESGGLGHGLFTYAIIEALEGKADGGSNDQKITIGELKTYVEDRVPELSEMYHGSAQFPTSYSFGQDFPLVITE